MMQVHGTIETEFKETEVGLIPVDWDIVQAQDVCLKVTDGTHDTPKPADTGFPLVTTKHLKDGRINLSEAYLISEEDYHAVNERSKVDKYDVLIGMIGTIGSPVLITDDDPAFAIKNIGLFKTGDEVLGSFLSHYLSSDLFTQFIDKNTSGSTQRYVPLGLLRELPIPFPPRPEQRRIAAVLTAIQADIAAQEDIITEARAFKRSLMQRLFTYGPGPVPAETRETEIGEIPAHWEVVPLNDVIVSTQYGLSERADRVGQYPMLRMNNLGDGYVSTANLKYIDLDDETFWKFKLTPGDVLFNRTNSLELVGKTSLFEVEGDFVFASYLIRVVADPDRLLPGYLNYYLNLDDTQIRLKALATRGVSQSNISATKLRAFEIPLAPVTEQYEIAVLLADAGNKIAVEEDRKAALQAVFKSSLHQLMTGQVRLLSDEGVPL
jgi:type I restriction enzyme S subunit